MSVDLTTSPPHPGSEANLGYLFRLAHQRFRALLDSELEDLGLSAQEYGILSVFETRPELSTSELARITQVTRQTMHPAVLSLEAAGLLERRARNQRVVCCAPPSAEAMSSRRRPSASARLSAPHSLVSAAGRGDRACLARRDWRQAPVPASGGIGREGEVMNQQTGRGSRAAHPGCRERPVRRTRQRGRGVNFSTSRDGSAGARALARQRRTVAAPARRVDTAASWAPLFPEASRLSGCWRSISQGTGCRTQFDTGAVTFATTRTG